MVGRTLPLLLVSLTALAGAAGCTRRVGTLSLVVTRPPPDEHREPLDNVASFVRVRLDGPDLQVSPDPVPVGDRLADLQEIPVGEGRQVTVEGLGPEDNVVSRGRSAPFAVVPGDNEIGVFVGLIGTHGEFSPAPQRMNRARAFHTAALLADGSLFLAGGTASFWRPESKTQPSDALRSSERIDGSSLGVEQARSACVAPTDAACMSSGRIGHTATLLESGNVLLAGGSNGIAAAASSELYQPGPRLFYRVPDAELPQLWHQAALCERGVALIGGVDSVGDPVGIAQIYEGGVVRPAFPALRTPRRAFTLTALADGRLLAAGGFDADGLPLATTELLGPGGATWTPGPAMTVARAHHSATLLDDGTLLVAGGLGEGGLAATSIERLDPSSGPWTRMNDELKIARWGHTATLLSDGRVLVVGGFGIDRVGMPTPSVEAMSVLGPAELHVLRLPDLPEGRAGHTATRLGSGMVVVAGGTDGVNVLDSLEVFVY